jgi:hypothetical protein
MLPRCSVTFGRNPAVAMRTSLIIASIIASAAASCAAALMLADPVAALDFRPAFDASRVIATHAWAISCEWATDNYSRTPALMVGLAAVLLMPPLALASGVITRFALLRHAGRQSPTQYLGQYPSAVGDSGGANVAAPDHPSNMAWPREAWLTGSAPAGTRQPPLLRSMPRELLSIGRGEDNDLVLDEATVHRYHAIIQRTPDTLFLIKDLGGPGGNGVFVNGERVTEAHLLDADRIALGNVLLVFHARRVGDDSYRHGKAS